MITQLLLSNFKAFGNLQAAKLRPITLIFGANSSGKSSLLHSLLLLHHISVSGEVNARYTKLGGTVVDLGGFKQYVHRNKIEESVVLTLRTNATFDIIDRPKRRSAKEMTYEIQLEHGSSTTYNLRTGEEFLAEVTSFAGRTRIKRCNPNHSFFAKLERAIKRFYDNVGLTTTLSVTTLLEIAADVI
jgi:AAA15 family ATPase/GTPase